MRRSATSVVLLVALLGCGRLDYEPRATSDGGSDAGEPGPAPFDAGRAGDAGELPCTATELCEDFEEPVELALWSVSTTGTGSIERSETAASTGAFGLATRHSGAIPSVQQAFLERALVSAPRSGSLFVQFDAFVAAAPAATWSVLFELMGEGRVGLNLVPGGSIATLDFGGGPVQVFTRPELPRGRWVCVRLELDLAAVPDASGRASVWFDDALVAESPAGVQTAPADGWQSLRVGVISGENQVPVEAQYDRLRVSTTPLRCN